MDIDLVLEAGLFAMLERGIGKNIETYTKLATNLNTCCEIGIKPVEASY